LKQDNSFGGIFRFAAATATFSDRIRRLQGNDETRIGGGMDFGAARRGRLAVARWT
jgi:hypothetical protein